jgi:lipopolysaccharide biosynthesis glycosyltransferase
MKRSEVCFAFACDKNYFDYFNILVDSIERNTSISYDYHLFSFDDLPISKAVVEFELHKLSIEDFDYLPLNVHLTPETYIRFVIPKYLDRYDYVIYLDVDMLVLGDIDDLVKRIYDVPFIGAVDAMDSSLAAHHNLHRYWNAGLLVVNTKWWIKNNVEVKLFDRLQDKYFVKRLRFSDQCVINVVLCDFIQEIDLKFNVHSNVNIPETRIRHFSGNIKPWYLEYNGLDKKVYRERMKEFGVGLRISWKSVLRIVKNYFA